MPTINNPTATGISERDFRAIKAFLVRSTVPLIYESVSDAGIQGSGCLFDHEGILYFVTAGHVLEGVDPYKLGIPIHQENSEIFSLGSGVVGWSRNEEYDVSAYRIDDEEIIQKLRRSYLILSIANTAPLNCADGHFIVAGYPAETVSRTGMTLTPKDLTQIYTTAYQDEVIGQRTAYDLFLKLDRKAYGLWGNPITVPNIRGISGGPVWQIRESTSQVWTPESVLRLVAIQVSCDPKGERYMRALSWVVVQTALTKLASVPA
jgi:hypothetical protein